MVDVAKLSLTADTTGLKQAVPTLDAIVAAGKKAATTSAALRAEIARTDAALKAMKASGSGSKTEMAALTSQMNQLRARLAESKAESVGLATEMHNLKSASTVAGHQVGNLSAQIFDIGMMMQAGQNPFVLMVQQGSQVAQILGPMGASGALATLRASFVQLLNPMNLAVFGVIGVSAVLVPMIADFFSASESVEEYGKRLEKLQEQNEKFRSSAEASQSTISELSEKYGSLAMVAALALNAEAEREKAASLKALAAEVDILAASFGGLYQEELKVVGFTGTIVPAVQELRREFNFSEEAASQFLGLLRELETAEGPVATAQAARDLRTWLEEAYGSIDNMPARMQDFYNQLNDSTLQAAELQGTLDFIEKTAQQIDVVAAQINNTLNSADGSALNAAFSGAFPLAYQLLGIAKSIKAALSPQGAVDDLNKQGLAYQYSQYGAGRSSFEAAAREGGSLYNPYDYPTVDEFGGGPPPGRPMDLGIEDPKKGGGRSASTSEAQKEAEAIQKVVESLRSEIDMVGKSEEARRLHQELQKAGVSIYSEEGQQIALLVEELTRLEQKQKLVAETMKGIENAAQNFFVGVLSGAQSLEEALGNLLRELGNLFLNQAFQMLWNGTGGGGGIGGWLAGLFDAGGHIPKGQVGIVAEKRPEFVDGKLVTQPTLVPGPANVTGGAQTNTLLKRAMASAPTSAPRRYNGMEMAAPRVTVAPAPVVVLDDPRKIDAWQRSPEGERTAAWQRRRSNG